MEAIVMMGNRSCLRVDKNIFAALLKFNPINGMDIIADKKMAVPAADR
jgi:hypothetical protein